MYGERWYDAAQVVLAYSSASWARRTRWPAPGLAGEGDGVHQ